MLARGSRVGGDQLGGGPARRQGQGGLARRKDQVGVALEVGEAQQRHAALALAEVLAGTAQGEVALRDLEAVAAFVDHLEAAARGGPERRRVERDAYAVARATPDPAAQLGEALQ